MLLELVLFIVGFITVISAIDFIAKTTSNIAHSFGIPEYLTSTIVLSFIIVVPIFLIMFISNLYDAPVFGLSVVIGFSVTVLTLVMGYMLLKNELPIDYEGYRNSTFLWAAAVLLFIVSVDKFIDRMDAIFMLLLFAFYVVYIIYRTGKSKEYVYLKTLQFNKMLYPFSIIAILISSWFLVYSSIGIARIFDLSLVIFGSIIISLLMALPLFDIIPSIFRSSRLTFDNLVGNVIICLTLVPAAAALIMPIPLTLGGTLGLFPFIVLNVVALSFALATRMSYTLHKKTGIGLLLGYILFILVMFFI